MVGQSSTSCGAGYVVRTAGRVDGKPISHEAPRHRGKSSWLGAGYVVSDPAGVRCGHEIGQIDPLPSEYLQVFVSLWRDRGAQMALRRGNEYALHDNLMGREVRSKRHLEL